MALSSVLSNIAANVPLPHSSKIIWTETTKPSRRYRGMSVHGVRRDKAALSSGCKPHPATAPAGSNRSSHGGNEEAEAFD